MAGFVRAVTATRSIGSSSIVFTFPSNVAIGDTLILSLYVNNWIDRVAGTFGNTTFGTPSGGGVSWVKRSQQQDPPISGALGFAGNGNPGMWTWTGINSSGGLASRTVTVPIVGGQYAAISGILSQFNGVSAILSQPDAVTLATGYPDDAAPTPTLATTYNADLLYLAWYAPTNASSISGPLTGGFSAVATVTTNFNSFATGYEATMAAGWRLQTLAGNYSAQWANTSGGAWGWSGLGLALKLVGPAAALAAIDSTVSGDAAVLTAPTHITVPPAVFNRGDRHIFGGVDLSTFAITQRGHAIGGDSHPALRGENPPWSGLPGSQALEQLPGSRIYTLNLFVHGRNSDGSVGAAEDVQARANLDALQAILAAPAELPLIRVMPDGTGRQAFARVWSVQEIDGRSRNVLFALKVDFMLADPWFYTDSVIDGPRALSSASVAFSLVHPGSVKGHHVLFDLLGPMTNPRITNLTTGTWVQYTGAIPNNQRLQIDCEHFSAFLVGANVVGKISHAGGVPFMWIAPGLNQLVVTSSPNGGSLTTTFAPGWI